MKKLFLSLFLFVSLAAYADEGMWLPHLIGQQRYAEMKAKGLKLTPEDLYSINKGSIKDAIVLFGGFCTGEVVSPQGMIFTNHHCGYGAINAASTLEHNYLRDGFYAKTLQEEIRAEGLFVLFLVRIDDVTREVQDSMKGKSYSDWEAIRGRVFSNVATAKTRNAGPGYEGRVYSMFRDNQFLLFTYQRYTDVRLVGAPPESVGKFGGDTDNWEWPRHTGDFSIFRVYADASNNPAGYSPNNVPMKPKHHLPISLKGVKDGDFSMIWGYPGGTNRFETSYGVKLATDIKNPAFVHMRDIRLKAMFEQIKQSDEVKLKLADSYASLANYWKFFDGETKQLLKYGVFEKKQEEEKTLQNWISRNRKTEYANLFADFEKAYADWRPFAEHKEFYEQGIMGPTVMRLSNTLVGLENVIKEGGDVQRAITNANRMRGNLLARIDLPSEQKMLGQLLQAYQKGIEECQQPLSFYYALGQEFGPLDDETTYSKWAENAFRNSVFLDDTRWATFTASPTVEALHTDPIYKAAKAFRENWAKYSGNLETFNSRINHLSHLYLKAYREANPNMVTYPDANMSMRVSYGQVLPYEPRDAVVYDYVTTSKGILEKYKPGDYEFDLPVRQLELLRKKEFGQYADAVRKDLVINFITNDDITGGNSGSPVINGNGELIGLAFDGNYEALSHKMTFDNRYNRTISVDIRYVLWCIDILGGAKNIIEELTLRK